jgi:hypothetical protein
MWFWLGGNERRSHRMWYIVLALWIVVGVVTATPDLIHRKEHRYWRPAPVSLRSFLPNAALSQSPLPQLWCTIGGEYELPRLLGKYLWLWIAFFTFVLYIPLALWAKGCITRRYPPEFTVYSMIAYVVLAETSKDIILKKSMLSSRYPVSNAILIVPLSIVRWVQLNRSRPIRTRDSIAVATVFDLNGLVNVLLMIYLRPNLFRGEPHTARGGVANGNGVHMESIRTQDESSSVLDR